MYAIHLRNSLKFQKKAQCPKGSMHRESKSYQSQQEQESIHCINI